MDKVAEIYINEPANLKLNVANRTLWSLYAIGYKNEKLLDKLSKTIAHEHVNLQMPDVVGAFKAYAYFKYLHMEARDGLVKTSIRNS